MNFNFTLTDPLRSVNAEIDLAYSQPDPPLRLPLPFGMQGQAGIEGEGNRFQFSRLDS